MVPGISYDVWIKHRDVEWPLETWNQEKHLDVSWRMTRTLGF
jgi:hypothetical protein